MATRAKVRRSSTRRAIAVATRGATAGKSNPRSSRPERRERLVEARKVAPAPRAPVARAKHAANGSSHSHSSHPAVPPAVPSSQGGYVKALRSLATLADFERMRIVRYNSNNFNLDRMRTLLKKIGNPHEHFRSVHVAGTKGKGSTCAMIASMLQACGYKIGLYTSPHLVDVRERITINGEMIPQADFARLVRLIDPVIQKIKPLPSYFDALTAIAFKYFAEQKVDLAVVETGLGGRLDSTNVITPEVTAITSISKDHMAQLGPTLSHIAAEKAGIFKHGIPALTVVQDPDVEAVLRKTAEQVGAPFDVAGKSIEFSYRFESTRMLGAHHRICLTTPQSKFEHLAVPLLGEHQAINCGLALSVLDRLKARGIAINDARAMEGLAKTVVPGRMEMVSTTPRIIVDGAHNAASLDALMKAIGQHIPYDSMVVIFGCCSDKDVTGMLERITSGADKVIFTKVDNIRTSNPEELAARYVEQYGKMAQVAHTLEDALGIANRAVSKEDLICITGSFYLVGEAKKYFAAKALAAKPVGAQ